MKKRILRMMLIAVIVLAMLPVPNAAAADTYTITTLPADNGSFTVTVGGTEATSAAPGDTVTITATPVSGYVDDVVTVTSSAGQVAVQPLSAAAGTARTYTFIMPDHNVVIDAMYQPL